MFFISSKTIKQQLCEVMSMWEEEQLARSMVYNHLKTVSPPAIAEEFKVKFQVAPCLAQESQNKHGSSMESTPNLLDCLLQKMIFDILSKENTIQNGNDDQDCNKHREPQNKRIKRKDTFAADEVKRNERAVSMKETAGEVAKEMGRKYNTVFKKMKNIERSAGMKSGKFSAEEDQRIRMAVINEENYFSS